MWDAESDEVKAEVQAALDQGYPKAKDESDDGREALELAFEGGIELDGGLTPADAQK